MATSTNSIAVGDYAPATLDSSGSNSELVESCRVDLPPFWCAFFDIRDILAYLRPSHIDGVRSSISMQSSKVEPRS
jgi:hypothetical protein